MILRARGSVTGSHRYLQLYIRVTCAYVILKYIAHKIPALNLDQLALINNIPRNDNISCRLHIDQRIFVIGTRFD